MTERSADISVRDLTKSFGETWALNGCSFQARLGEIHAIVGENGSGKSTLAKILSGVLLADAGEVSVLGATPRTPIQARRLGIATIFQEILVADEATVVDNLFVGADGLWRKTLSPRAKRDAARETLRRFTGLAIDPDARVGDLPLSLKQWIVIGRAILTKPRVLILDESSAALDLDATVRLHEEMRALRDQGSSIIIVTHRIAELVRITDRATILRDGQAVGELEKAEITEKNLLALMTPQGRTLSAGPQRRATAGAKGAVAISAPNLKITPQAEAFDFALSRGEIVGVTGLDGQGQEHFVRVMAGILPAQQGLPLASDEAGRETPLRNLADAERLRVAYVSGDRKREGIFPELSILENLGLGLYRRNRGFAGWIRRKPIAEAFAAEVKRLSVKIGKPGDKITSLSGGNQQKVLIGRAFATAPAVIVLNDPARGVDLNTKRDLYVELRRYAEAGGAVIYLSSEIEEFLGFADRVDVFRDGRIFRSLAGAAVTEEAILAAMFGHATAVSFDLEEAAQ